MAVKNLPQAGEQRIVKALAEKAKEVFGAQPSYKNIQRIAYEVELYAQVLRSSATKRRESDKRVADAVEALRAALAQSATFHDTFSVALGPEGESALENVERIARELSKKAARGRPRNAQLRRLLDVVLDAFWDVCASKIGKSGVNTKNLGDTRYGPTLDFVKDALRLAGVPEENLPPDNTIQKIAREVKRKKIAR